MMKILNDIKTMTLIKLTGYIILVLTECLIFLAAKLFIKSLQFNELLQVVTLQTVIFGAIWGVKFGSDWQKRKIGGNDEK